MDDRFFLSFVEGSRVSTMKYLAILALTIASTFAARAQEYSIYIKTDTVTLRDLVFPTPENPLWQPQTFLAINPLDSVKMASLPPGFLRTEMLSLPTDFSDRFDLTSSLKLEWNQEDPSRFFQTALRYTFAAGEAYMVYRALKKYRHIR